MGKQDDNVRITAKSAARLLTTMEAKGGGGNYALAIDTNCIGGPPQRNIVEDDGVDGSNDAMSTEEFRFGKLQRLRSLQDAGVTLLTTEVWQKEILRHLHLVIDARRKKASSAAVALNKFGVEPFLEIAGNLQLELQKLPTAEGVWGDFCKSVGMTTVEVIDADSIKSLELYRGVQLPFQQDKRSEFPDALSLLALDRHAEHHDLHIAVVTNDNGCLRFCEVSQRLHGFMSLELALEALRRAPDVVQRTQKLPEARAMLEQPSLIESLKTSVRSIMTDPPVDVSNVRTKVPGQDVHEDGVKRYEAKEVVLDATTASVRELRSDGMLIECRISGAFTMDRDVFCFDGTGGRWRATVQAVVTLDQQMQFFLSYQDPRIKPSDLTCPKRSYRLIDDWVHLPPLPPTTFPRR